jgi:hypothetical protein
MAATGKQYAVIEARWKERPSERFVISYSDEESLRDFIAGPNILACGFASLRDAEAHIGSSLLAAAPDTQPGSALAVTRNDRRPSLSQGESLGIGFCLTQTWRILHELSQAALAAIVLAFYSKNAVSAVIRSLVGSTG